MIKPDIKTYEILQENYDQIPISLTFFDDYHTPIGIFEKLKDLKPNYLLESAGEHQEHGRYSYIGMECKNISSSIKSVSEIQKINSGSKAYKSTDLPPFYNGCIGYLSYESIDQLHAIELKKGKSQPDFQVIYSKITIIIDHFTNKITLVYNTDSKSETYIGAQSYLQMIRTRIREYVPTTSFKPLEHSATVTSNMTKAAYTQKVKKAQDYIRDGDIFQVVLSQKFKTKLEVAPFEIYKAVRRENPSPYLSYIEFDGFTAICSSPELLLKNIDKNIYTAPIAGTRAVKHDGRDHLRAHELINDAKECSEHLMLVDLGRNDVGKVSKAGTVTVESFCQVKKYAKVMHLVSSVKGELKDNLTPFDALVSTFPAGTVSGAPKKRAIEIIDELEEDARGLYAGTIFYMTDDQSINSCIAIRTMILTDEITIQSGGGIVYGSNPDDEYKETLNKASALFNALNHIYKGGINYDFDHR